MRPLVILFILLFATSCNYFEKKKVSPEEILKEELNTFNWNDVDTYPTFTSCDSILAKEESKLCFQNTLINSVNQFLEAQNLVVSNDINDTIILKIKIDNVGLLEVESIKVHPETVLEIPEIENLLHESLKSIPQVFPAIKRGQQVTTTFELPVIVRID